VAVNSTGKGALTSAPSFAQGRAKPARTRPPQEADAGPLRGKINPQPARLGLDSTPVKTHAWCGSSAAPCRSRRPLPLHRRASAAPRREYTAAVAHADINRKPDVPPRREFHLDEPCLLHGDFGERLVADQRVAVLNLLDDRLRQGPGPLVTLRQVSGICSRFRCTVGEQQNRCLASLLSPSRNSRHMRTTACTFSTGVPGTNAMFPRLKMPRTPIRCTEKISFTRNSKNLQRSKQSNRVQVALHRVPMTTAAPPSSSGCPPVEAQSRRRLFEAISLSKPRSLHAKVVPARPSACPERTQPLRPPQGYSRYSSVSPATQPNCRRSGSRPRPPAPGDGSTLRAPLPAIEEQTPRKVSRGTSICLVWM